MAGLFGCAAVALLPSLWFTGPNLFANTIHISVSLYMAVVPMFLGYLLFGYGLRTTEASKATLITLIEPLVATLFAIFLIGEVFKPHAVSTLRRCFFAIALLSKWKFYRLD
jgi:DME family drug/metabolite transporter